VAIVVSLVAHVTGWSGRSSGGIERSRESQTICCSITVTDSGLTATDATGAGGGGGGGAVDWRQPARPVTLLILVHVRQK